MQLTILVTIFSITLISLVQSATIKGSYIVKLKGKKISILEKHIKAVESLFRRSSGKNKIKSQFKELGLMYHAKFSNDVVKKVKSMTEVLYVEADKKMKGSTIQKNAPWGLARMSQRGKTGKPLNYKYNGDGSGVTVYVVDSGVYIKHPEFGGRAKFGARFITNNNNDEYGHGTQVAGIIGSKSYGVAKNVKLVSVKVLDANNDGSASSIISGINWSVSDKRGKKGNVINMSVGGKKTKAVNDAVKAAVGKGFVFVSAAGNENLDACLVSPASEPKAITVAATNINDARAVFSNWGRCVTVFAPGKDIISTTKDGRAGIESGTSTAAPHVAGLAACLLSQKTESPDAIRKRIIKLASKNVVSNPGTNTFNCLIYNGVA